MLKVIKTSSVVFIHLIMSYCDYLLYHMSTFTLNILTDQSDLLKLQDSSHKLLQTSLKMLYIPCRVAIPPATKKEEKVKNICKTLWFRALMSQVVQIMFWGLKLAAWREKILVRHFMYTKAVNTGFDISKG